MNGTEVVVVTGASTGDGRATVRACAQRGAFIVLLARGRDGLAPLRIGAASTFGQDSR
jgi:NADP-dependent 3-hydroxy acid dehydrogenase YdfG